MLQRAIASYRDRHQGPILQRASSLFCRLTLGDYAGLATAFGQDDNLVLVAVRQNKEQVEVAGLSDGTRDQMYLALRLAAIEHHIETVAACPVIFDDILINSDDSRSAAALEVISQLARRTQVLFAFHSKARLVVKLPADRVEALVRAGTGERFDPGHGRVMKEWLAIPHNDEKLWPRLAREALEFALSAAPKSREPRAKRT